MFREFKTATVMNNEKIKVGDKVIRTNENGSIPFHGIVTAIYRLGESRTFITVQSKDRTWERIFACAVRKAQ